jgi:hypothetical protein
MGKYTPPEVRVNGKGLNRRDPREISRTFDYVREWFEILRQVVRTVLANQKPLALSRKRLECRVIEVEAVEDLVVIVARSCQRMTGEGLRVSPLEQENGRILGGELGMQTRVIKCVMLCVTIFTASFHGPSGDSASAYQIRVGKRAACQEVRKCHKKMFECFLMGPSNHGRNRSRE